MNWFMAQGFIIVGALILSLLGFRYLGWRTGFLNSISSNFKLFTEGFFPILASLGSLILGVVYLFAAQTYTIAHFICFFVLPIGYLLFIILRGRKWRKEEKEQDRFLIESRKRIEEWVGQFTFLNSKLYSLRTHANNNQVCGHIFIRVTEEQKKLVEEKQNEISDLLTPDQLTLQVISQEEYEWATKVSQWVLNLPFQDKLDVHDTTRYQEREKPLPLHGLMYITTKAEHFPTLETYITELPSDIQVQLCTDRQYQQRPSFVYEHSKEEIQQQFGENLRIITT